VKTTAKRFAPPSPVFRVDHALPILFAVPPRIRRPSLAKHIPEEQTKSCSFAVHHHAAAVFRVLLYGDAKGAVTEHLGRVDFAAAAHGDENDSFQLFLRPFNEPSCGVSSSLGGDVSVHRRGVFQRGVDTVTPLVVNKTQAGAHHHRVSHVRRRVRGHGLVVRVCSVVRVHIPKVYTASMAVLQVESALAKYHAAPSSTMTVAQAVWPCRARQIWGARDACEEGASKLKS